MTQRLATMLFAVSLLVLAGVRSSAVRADESNPPPSTTYVVKIAGYVSGNGTGTCSGSKISITASVEDEDGNKGDFVANDLTFDDKSHFHGTGTVLGKSMTISGRLDRPQPGEKRLKVSRVVGTFATSDGHYGRIAGYVSTAKGKPGG